MTDQEKQDFCDHIESIRQKNQEIIAKGRAAFKGSFLAAFRTLTKSVSH